MCFRVCRKIPSIGEPFPTGLAFEGLLSRVDRHMPFDSRFLFNK